MSCNKPFAKLINGSYELIPCGFCSGCRKDRITMWCMRVQGEAMYYNNVSTFLTLTYDELHVPMLPDFPMYTLNFVDSTAFWKAYRKANAKKANLPFKYLLTGEYGYKGERALLGGNPHFHCLVLGHSPDYVEELADDVWHNGYNYALPLLDGGTRYVCKYIDKQVSRKAWAQQCLNVQPQLRCSQGIGVRYFLDNLDNIRANGGIYDRGTLRPIPKYYIDKFALEIEHSPEYQKKKALLRSYLFVNHLDRIGIVANNRIAGCPGLQNNQREYNTLFMQARRTRRHET